MHASTPCPGPGQLRGLLDDSLSPGDQGELVRHLDSCTSCQQALERLATDGNPAAVPAARPDRPGAGSAYWPAVADLERLVVTTPAPPAGPTTPRPTLDFLQPSDRPGTLGRLAHFDVERILGRGGMGVVLQAFDTHLQRSVAVKVLDPATATSEVARQRFCREARAAASVTHEHVVTVHHVEREEASGLPYLVM